MLIFDLDKSGDIFHDISSFFQRDSFADNFDAFHYCDDEPMGKTGTDYYGYGDSVSDYGNVVESGSDSTSDYGSNAYDGANYGYDDVSYDDNENSSSMNNTVSPVALCELSESKKRENEEKWKGWNNTIEPDLIENQSFDGRHKTIIILLEHLFDLELIKEDIQTWKEAQDQLISLLGRYYQGIWLFLIIQVYSRSLKTIVKTSMIFIFFKVPFQKFQNYNFLFFQLKRAFEILLKNLFVFLKRVKIF